MRIIGNDPSTPRQAQIVASGTLSTGDAVVVNSDGTVSVVAETGVSQNLGSPAVFSSVDIGTLGAAYDANAQKVVIAYRDDDNSLYGTAVVGTVNGNSISFGTPVVFESASTSSPSITYDDNAQKVVVAYADAGNSDYGTAIVGTVSGTSISFGSATVFESATTFNPSATYDANAQKVVVAYEDNGNSRYGTAIVGTVSGTSISFGTAVVFESANTTGVSTTYDSNAQKVVIGYTDNGNSSHGTAIVGTVSGTSISFGTAAVFESAVSENISVGYDSTAAKIVIAYRDGGNSSYGTAIVGTVSGTSISFGSAVVFEAASSGTYSVAYDANSQKAVIAYRDAGNSNYVTVIAGTVDGTSISFDSALAIDGDSSFAINAVYDSSAQKVVIAYNDGSNSDYGTAAIYQAAYTSTNLTAENYIGTAKSGAADGDGVVVNTQGNVDTGQTGLTAGQSYYVQTDGTLGTTPADPSVFAGTAVGENKLIVKG